MDREIAGFTLIEILVTLAIMGAMLAIAIPAYTDWQMERQISSDTKKVLSFLQEERAKAFSTKQTIQLTIDGTKSICDDMGNCVHTKNAFEATSINMTISSRGVFDNGHIRIQDDSMRKKYEPKFSCVSLTTTRARPGEYDASTSPKCEAK